MKFNTLNDIIRKSSADDKKGITIITGADKEETILYKDLYRTSLSYLSGMKLSGLKPGDLVVLQLKDLENFITVFWSLILGGMIPVPLTVAVNDESLLKLSRVLKKIKHGFLISDYLEKLKSMMIDAEEISGDIKMLSIDKIEVIKSEIKSSQSATMSNKGEIQSNKGEIKSNKCEIEGREIESVEKKESICYKPGPDEVAFIQFSSGSTGNPKGIIMTHKNITSNINAIINGVKATGNDSSLSWLPLTHDLGLIGFHLSPMAALVNQYIMDTKIFIRRPSLWLSKASEHKISVTASPNFGYDYYLKNIKRDNISNDLDLSNIRVIFNGAEPIDPDLCRKFLKVLEPCGLACNTMFPVYGLAEAGLAVTFPEPGENISSINVKRSSIRIGEKIGKADSQENNLSVICVGKAVNGCQIRICDDKNNLLDDLSVGLIQIKGENVSSGYFQSDKGKNNSLTDDGWLVTGDLGFMVKGRLFVIGRSRDMVCIRGKNIYLHDIERVALDSLEEAWYKAAAISFFDNEYKRYEIVLFILFKKKLKDFEGLAAKIRRDIEMKVGIRVKRILPTSKIYMTTSGKIQRYKMEEDYFKGKYKDIEIELSKLHLDKLKDKRKEYQSVRTLLAKDIYYIFSKVTGEKDIGFDDNIFEYGINSLKLMEILSRIDEKYPGMIAMSDIFNLSTINKLISRIEKSLDRKKGNMPEGEDNEINLGILIKNLKNGDLSKEQVLKRLKKI